MQNKTVILHGVPKLNGGLLNKINQRLNKSDYTISNVQWVYLVSCNDLAELAINKLESLLEASQKPTQNQENCVYVAPRIGTISPWSSKATDILVNCGFSSIHRIEQAVLYKLTNHSNSHNDYDELHDKMMQSVYSSIEELYALFDEKQPQQSNILTIGNNIEHLNQVDERLGLVLSNEEKQYLLSSYNKINKEPTEAELMMFAQANSEHCRHKIFNAEWHINAKKQDKSLFSMIRNTEKQASIPAISAYKDNSAVFTGGHSIRWQLDKDNKYVEREQISDVLIKVETHNHPTAISPFPGAATGSGGEIRDEAATGQGSRPKAGLTGYSVSHLKIPDFKQAWEQATPGKPERIASALEIMIEAPLGGAAFNNEFGRPSICGYFRSMEIDTEELGWRGYHKPIMLAGGMGTINRELAIKQDSREGDYLVVLGGPAMLIGLGGGAASSVSSGSSSEKLDFASVQRGNPEMQRRCQEVIDRCWTQSKNSPIRSIHDVGAGGLSNAMPELLDDAGLGGVLELRALKIDSTSMSAMEIWCNESQERYVLSIKPEKLEEFKQICQRERCPYAVMGQASKEKQLTVKDSHFKSKPIDIPMDLLFGNTPKTKITLQTEDRELQQFDCKNILVDEAIERILLFPTVASKKYLITIGDRTVSGLVHRDQMVGPWQVPVADCGVTLRDYNSNKGEVMSLGEKAPLALINGAASARMAVAEALTNCVANAIGSLAQIKMSANWMAAFNEGQENKILFDAVKAIGEELCPELDIGIPVGKDSLSMSTKWQDKQVTSPVSLIISAFANVEDVTKSITPYFSKKQDHTLYYIDIAAGKKRLGASSLAQVYNQIGNQAPDLDNVENLKQFWEIMQKAVDLSLLSAYHDISDGGLFVTLLEMSIASQTGLEVNLDFSPSTVIEKLFSEELGAVVAVEEKNTLEFLELIKEYGLSKHIHKIAKNSANPSKKEALITLKEKNEILYEKPLIELEQIWSRTSHEMAKLRDNPRTCEEEFSVIEREDKGLSPKIDFDYSETNIKNYINASKPKVAILREQGVNGQKEMAMAFYKAGFECYDVHMQDLLEAKVDLMQYQGLAVCGGFSYGDVLGAGKGWANSILFHDTLKKNFENYFSNENKFTLGICNGCQMLSALKDIIPGANNWPKFEKNSSQQFEARFSSLKIEKSNSLFFAGMQGAEIPVAIAHGEGRASFDHKIDRELANIAAKYADNDGNESSAYPYNPNGSDYSAAAISNEKGNVLIMMPHPERVFRAEQMSWSPKKWQNNSPWMRMFYNARKFIN